MKNNILHLFSILFLLCSTSLLAQSKSNDFIGKWKAINCKIIGESPVINNMDAKHKAKFELMQQAFSKSRFIFSEDHSCSIEIPDLGHEFLKELTFLRNQKWQIHQSQIRIGNDKDGYGLMIIQFVKDNGRNFFIIPDSFIQIEISKQ